MRDEVVDFVVAWSDKTEIPAVGFLGWIGFTKGKYYDWKQRDGKVNEHNGKIARDFWLEDWEREAIVAFHDQHPLEGYRRLAFMRLDEDVVATGPSTVCRGLRDAGRLDRWSRKPSSKGTGFRRPEGPHRWTCPYFGAY